MHSGVIWRDRVVFSQRPVDQCKQLVEETEGKDGASSRGKTISVRALQILSLKRAQLEKAVFG